MRALLNFRFSILSLCLLAIGSGTSQATATAASSQEVTLPETSLSVGDYVSITLVTGHEVEGQVSTESDANYLWLSKSEAGVDLASGFPRSKIASWNKSNRPAPQVDSETATTPTAASLPATASRQSASPTVSTVASLEIFARVANWDSDAEADGIEVLLRPLDTRGELVVGRGQVDFKLLGQQGGNSRNQRFTELSQWSERLQDHVTSEDGIVVRLEFRNFHPDRQLDVDVESLLQARLSVPGQGVFEAVSPSFYLRPFSRLRDDLQLQTGSRHFSQERFSP